MKILDRYIFTTFFKNFISTLCILLLVFVFYAIWQLIDEFAGRGLEIWVILKLIMLYVPQLAPIIIPLTVILSSIMTFGALSESYELAAMKASGVSLLRAVRVLTVFMVFLAVGVFFLSNNIIPLANEKAVDLRLNIAKVKPAMAIQEGIFSDIGDQISIKVGKKSGKNDAFLKDIVIHKKTSDRINRTVIHAKTGELVNHEQAALIQLVLEDGTYYEDIKVNDYQRQQANPFAKADFQKHIMNIDLSELNNVDMNQKNNITTYRMMNVSQLSSAIDSVTADYKENITAYGESLYRRTGIAYLTPLTSKNNANNLNFPLLKKDTIGSISELMNLFSPEDKVQIYDTTIENNLSQLNNYQHKEEDIQRRNKQLNMYYITLNGRLALGVSCLVLFFVSVPLGAIIRKGGLGLPLVVAMALFLTYYFIGMLLNNFAEDGTINPIWSAWISTILFIPIGGYLTYKVVLDKPLY